MRYAHVLALLLVLAGCDGREEAAAPTTVTTTLTTTVTRTVTTAPSEPELPWESCTVYREQDVLQVTFEGRGADTLCVEAARQWSNAQQFWRRAKRPVESRREACALTRLTDVGRQMVTVREASTEGASQAVCGELVAAGWYEQDNADP